MKYASNDVPRMFVGATNEKNVRYMLCLLPIVIFLVLRRHTQETDTNVKLFQNEEKNDSS